MAEDTLPKDAASSNPTFYNIPTEPITLYVDSFQASIRASDVKIKMGDSLVAGEESIVRASLAVAMSHTNFLQFADAAAHLAVMLRESYGGNPPTFNGTPAEKPADVIK